MIQTDFAYYRPENLSQVSGTLARAGQRPFCFYGGGSEILSMARVGSMTPGAVIDLKAIPECRYLDVQNGRLLLGAAVTLSEIAESGLFPLLGTTVSRIADHTNQCRITLGGNVCGTIIYREAVLPLLLADATVCLWSQGELQEMPIEQAFRERLQRQVDEFVVRFSIPQAMTNLPYVHVKRTRGEKIDYPLCTITAIKAPDGIRLAFSGVYGYPFRNRMLEKIASDSAVPSLVRADRIVQELRGPVLSDLVARADYRLLVLREALRQTLERLEGKQ